MITTHSHDVHKLIQMKNAGRSRRSGAIPELHEISGWCGLGNLFFFLQLTNKPNIMVEAFIEKNRE